MRGITIIFIYLYPKQNKVSNEKQRTEMEEYVKNGNILAEVFGKMKYFATLSSHRQFLVYKPLIFSNFTKSFFSILCIFLCSYLSLYVLVQPYSHVFEWDISVLFFSEQLLI